MVNAISTCIAQANAIGPKVPAFPTLTDNTGGTSGAGTVAAVTVTVTAAGTALASAAGTKAVVQVLRERLFQLNKLAVATGTVGVTGTPLVAADVDSFSTTFAAVSTSTGTGCLRQITDRHLKRMHPRWLEKSDASGSGWRLSLVSSSR